MVQKLEFSLGKQLGNPLFNFDDCKSYHLNKKNFHEIKPASPKRKIAFVDGGNQEIFHAPNFSIQVNRVYFSMFRNNERILPKSDIPTKIEFISMVSSEYDKDKKEVFYETSIFPSLNDYQEYLPLEKDLSFSSKERAVMLGMQRYDIERVSSIARRFAEWSFSRHVIQNEMEDDDMIVRDGSLQISFANEDKYSEEAFKAAQKENVYFTGLSKTSHLYTDTGLSLIGSIQEFAEECGIDHDLWCYYPIADRWAPTHKAVIMIAKFNSCSDRIFRFEILREQFQKMDEYAILNVLSSIADNSKDFCFPGYPYGLIDADLRARVRSEELDIYRTLILSEISKKPELLNKFNFHVRATDSHDILNNIAGD